MNIIGGVLPAGRRAACGSTAPTTRRAARATPQAARHRVHPPGTQPVQEPQRRGKPVHRAAFPKRVAGLPFIDRARASAPARQELLARGRPRPPAEHAGQPAVAGRAATGGDRQGARRRSRDHHLRRAHHVADLARDRAAVRHHRPAARARASPSSTSATSSSDVMRLCDQIVVLRDGHVVGALRASGHDHRADDLADGRPHHRPAVSAAHPSRPRAGAPVLEVRGLTQPGIGAATSRFTLHAGRGARPLRA